jgi:hypothetical protein
VYYNCVKFHKNPISGLGGVALTRYMDGRTDRVIPIYPPNFVCGGYNYHAISLKILELKIFDLPELALLNHPAP